MKAKYFILSGLFCCLTVVSCDDIIVDSKPVYTNHFIHTYVDVDNVIVSPHESNPFAINIQLRGTYYDQPYWGISEKFNELSERYGDIYWDGYLPACQPDPPIVCNDFVRIDVISNAEFNGRPVYSSLSDVVKLLTSSPKKYIDSHCEEKFSWENDTPEDYLAIGEHYSDGCYYPVYGMLSSLGAEDLILLETGLVLVFTEVPEIKRHIFTVVFRDPRGTTHRGNILMTFE